MTGAALGIDIGGTKLATGRPSRLREAGDFTAADVVRLAHEGDAVAAQVWDETIGYLGLGAAAVALEP